MKKLFIHLGTLLLVLTLAASCGGNGENTNGNGNGNGGTTEITPDEGITLYGLVADTNGNPVSGVVVSDGYSCVETDKDGVYQIVRHTSAVYAFISVPAGYEAARQKNYGSYPEFYKSAVPISGSASKPFRVDFSINKRTTDDNDFVLVAIGDPQPDNDTHAAMFRDETIADIKKEMASVTVPKVALGLGDIVGKNETGNRFSVMKGYFGTLGFPMYVTIGNHDKSEGGGDNGEKFRSNFGPLYYSFNMGKAHFISLDNIIFSTLGEGGEYKLGVTDEQVAWIEKDLSFVSTDKLIVLYYHIPMRNNTGNAYKNIKKVLDLLESYPNVVMMCGHTHYFQPHHNTTHGRFERIHGAACGYFWRSRVAGDGAPNGYVIYEVSGNRITDSRFKATGKDKDYQIRLYRGNETYHGNYSFDLGDDHIVANVFFAGMDGGSWTIEVYENGVYSGAMTQMAANYGDRWIRGYLRGVLTYGDSAMCNCYHLFKYQLKDKSANVTVKVKDTFGNEYSQSVFTAGRNYDEAML